MRTNRVRRALKEDDRFPYIAQRLIDQMRHGMYGRGLPGPGHHKALPLMLAQVLGNYFNPLSPLRVAIAANDLQFIPANFQFRRQIRDEAAYVRRAHPQPVIRHCAGNRILALNDVQPVHLILGRRNPAPARELFLRQNGVRIQPEEIVVQCKDDVGLIELVPRDYRLSKRQLPASRALIVRDRVVFHPPRARILGQRRGFHRKQRRRADPVTEEAKPFAGSQFRAVLLGKIVECLPFDRFSIVHRYACAVWIVEPQHRCLLISVRRAQTVGMVRIAFNFRGPAVVHLYQKTHRRTALGISGAVEKRLTRDVIFHAAYVRKNLLHGTPAGR